MYEVRPCHYDHCNNIRDSTGRGSKGQTIPPQPRPVSCDACWGTFYESRRLLSPQPEGEKSGRSCPRKRAVKAGRMGSSCLRKVWVRESRSAKREAPSTARKPPETL